MSKKKSITRGTRKTKKYIETKFMIEEVYQKATEIFLSGLKEEAACYGHMPPTIIDMKRDVENSFDPKLPKTDSSSWTFHVEECPGWKFGLWWESVDANSPDDKPKILKGWCFTQYEQFIDKFKPSRSEYCADLILDFENIETAMKAIKELGHKEGEYAAPWSGAWTCLRFMEYIHKEPALAFCSDALGYDYKYEYLSREEAEILFANQTEKENKRRKLCMETRQGVINLLEKHINDFDFRGMYAICATTANAEDYEDYKVELRAPYKFNRSIIPERHGTYSLTANDEPDDSPAKLAEKEIEEYLEKQIEKAKAKDITLYTSNFFDFDVWVYKQKYGHSKDTILSAEVEDPDSYYQIAIPPSPIVKRKYSKPATPMAKRKYREV